jgi:AbrB family looped-hinge helix DNA binding protein
MTLSGYSFSMVVTTVTMGEKGQLVVPMDIRRRNGWKRGSSLVFVESDSGVQLISADDALAKFRASILGTSSPADELLIDRRREAAQEASD